MTALFYFGAVVGIGNHLRRWIVEADVSSSTWTFAPGIAAASVLQAGDISAFRALSEAVREPSVAEDAYEYVTEIDESFPRGTKVRALLESGQLWHNGNYIRQQLAGEIATRVRPERLVWLLKAFPASTEARDALRRYCGHDSIGVAAARVLVGFMHETIPAAALARQDIANADELTIMHGTVLSLFRRTADNEYYRLALSYEERDGDGRLRRARLYSLETS